MFVVLWVNWYNLLFTSFFYSLFLILFCLIILISSCSEQIWSKNEKIDWVIERATVSYENTMFICVSCPKNKHWLMHQAMGICQFDEEAVFLLLFIYLVIYLLLFCACSVNWPFSQLELYFLVSVNSGLTVCRLVDQQSEWISGDLNYVNDILVYNYWAISQHVSSVMTH